MEIYEVDLRDRKTGNSVECIYSGDNYDKAYEIADNWNRENLADYNEDFSFDDYVDHKTDGLSACMYVVEDMVNVHGVGKFSENCENCIHFYECDNIGIYEECLPDMKYYEEISDCHNGFKVKCK